MGSDQNDFRILPGEFGHIFPALGIEVFPVHAAPVFRFSHIRKEKALFPVFAGRAFPAASFVEVLVPGKLTENGQEFIVQRSLEFFDGVIGKFVMALAERFDFFLERLREAGDDFIMGQLHPGEYPVPLRFLPFGDEVQQPGTPRDFVGRPAGEIRNLPAILALFDQAADFLDLFAQRQVVPDVIRGKSDDFRITVAEHHVRMFAAEIQTGDLQLLQFGETAFPVHHFKFEIAFIGFSDHDRMHQRLEAVVHSPGHAVAQFFAGKFVDLAVGNALDLFQRNQRGIGRLLAFPGIRPFRFGRRFRGVPRRAGHRLAFFFRLFSFFGGGGLGGFGGNCRGFHLSDLL